MFCGEEEYSSPEMELSSTGSETKRKNKNKRRFSDEQIRSLETMFETDAKLEARQKLQLAKELGLQPRQVAIWFQNKRARWKSKQLEQDYSVLQNSYNSLVSKFEALKKENQTLTTQIRDLNEQLRNSQAGSSGRQEPEEKGRDDDSGYREDKCNSEDKPRLSLENNIIEGEIMIANEEYFGFEEPARLLADMTESADGSLTSNENWGNFDTDSLFDESSSSYQWWDFWS